MGTNAELVKLFNEIADLLDLTGERFKPEAYRRAARSLEMLGEDVRRVADRGGLDGIPGVGPAISEKIREYLRSGSVGYADRIRAQFAPGVLELLRIPGVGPKTARRFLFELNVQSPAELQAAITRGHLTGLKGFGARKIEQLAQGLATLAPTSSAEGRLPLLSAWEIAEGILRELRQRAPVRDLTVAGSLRRRRETIGDLDVLATSDEPAKVFEAFSSLPGVREVRLRGETKETVVYAPGVQVDLRVVEPASFGAALQYFTGSKDHNIHLRSLARDRGLKINEYGVFRGEERIAGATEEDVYASLGLPWIPAEIRENRGEIEAAGSGSVPPLIDAVQLRGDLHVHLASPARDPELSQWAHSAARRGYTVLGVVLPGTTSADGLGDVRQRWERLATTAGPPPPTLRVGCEWVVESTEPRGTDDPGFDFWIGVPSDGKPPEPATLERPAWALGHLDRAGTESGGSADRIAAWTEWARRSGVALEVTPRPESSGVDSGWVRWMIERDGDLALTAQAEHPEELDRIELAVGLSRRGWAPTARVRNASDDALPSARTTRASPRVRERSKISAARRAGHRIAKTGRG